MPTFNCIEKEVNKLVKKYKTRDPYEICDALGIKIRLMDLGADLKAYYLYAVRIRNIVVNTRASEPIRRILVAHELGHDRLHKEIAMLQGFREMELFDVTRELHVPPALLDFKFRALRHKGYSVDVPYIANGDFLKGEVDNCFDEEF